MTDEKSGFRKGGRPKKSDTDKRTLLIAARVRPDELAIIEGRAAETNRPLSDFIRDQALTGSVLVRAFRTFSAVDRNDLARIGSNLNQIARACNTSGDTYRARRIEDLLDQLRAVLERLETSGNEPNELGKGPGHKGPRHVL